MKNFAKATLKYLLIIVFAILNTSCTVLQWRSTDTEIKTYFDKKQIPTTVSYYTIDSLDLNIRVLEVKEAKRNVNLVFFSWIPEFFICLEWVFK